MKKIILLCVVFFMWHGLGIAGQTSVISLSDGTTLCGEIASLKNGVYVIKTLSLGTVSIPESRISSIRKGDCSGAKGPVNQDILKLQQKMTSDEEIMALISSLQNDPEMQAALNDPAVMSAVSAGDISALMTNPKFTALLQNAKVRQIQDKTLK